MKGKVIMEKTGLFVLMVFLVFAQCGCVPLLVGAAAGAGGVVYVRGAIEKNLDSSVDDVHSAALQALSDKGIFVTSDEVNRHDATIKAEYEDGQAVLIKMKALTEKSSKIAVRVGLMGDQVENNILLNAIESRL